MFGNQPNVTYNWNQNANFGQNLYNPMYYHHYQNALSYSQDNSSQNEILTILNNRKLDEEFIQHFVTEQSVRYNKSDGSKISQTKRSLQTIKLLNGQLKKSIEELNVENLSEEEWIKKCKDCELKKDKIRGLINDLKNEDHIKMLKRYIEKRKKKRLREKRVKAEWKNTKIELRERRIRLHVEADNWIKGRQNDIEKEKQEENLRKEADLVLCNVRGKRNDAKKYLTLLKELEHLRKIKVTIAKARGEYVSPAADEAFNNIIEKLVQPWTALDREYSIEEQGLKLMIQTDNELKFKKQKRNQYDCWEITLFGKKIPSDYFLQGDITTFIVNRSAWDKFLNSEEGKPIPVGWIVPDKPSSSAWQKYLKNE